jgi:hypothetical protein
MPELKTFFDLNKDEVEIVFISSVDWLETHSDKSMLDKYGFNDHPLLSIDIHEYGNQFTNWNRLSKFLKELIPDYSGEIALPTYLLFDNKGELLSFYNSSFKADLFKLE